MAEEAGQCQRETIHKEQRVGGVSGSGGFIEGNN